MAEEIQKHQLLVKLLKMTTSANDGEALTAVRKANDLLASAGWDWDRLMANKITVVGDPFANLHDPRPKVSPQAPKPNVQKPQTAGAFFNNFDDYLRPKQPAAASPTRRKPPINSTKTNAYEGHCWCCGRLVAIGGGFIFRPRDYHTRAVDAFRVVCTTDNISSNAILPSAAPRAGPGARKTTADDLA